MINRRFILEASTLILSAILCASVANGFADRDKKLKLVPGNNLVQRVPSPQSTVPSPQSTVPSPQSTVPSPQSPAPSPKPIVSGPGTGDQGPRTSNPGPGTRDPGPIAKPREFPAHPEKPWVEIDPAAVRELYEREVPFIDARRTSVYEEGHIAGARSIPVWEADLDERLKALYEEGLDPEAPIVVYCSGGNCEDSHMLAQRLWGLGLNNVLVYKDGYPDWVKNGGPTRTGPSR